MAQNTPKSASPRVSSHHGYAYAPAHATPAHSAHNSQNSLRSSTSSRNPLHTLSLHEYRKLQNTPTPQSATPPGKTLRRKAAAPALNEVERVPSVKRTPTPRSSIFARPFHLSHSPHHAGSYQQLPPSPPHFFEEADLSDRSFRSQPAQSAAQEGSAVEYSAEGARIGSEKVGTWKAARKLPKPLVANSRIPISPPPPFALSSARPLHTTPSSSEENVTSSRAGSTPSTFSLSRFPRPPHLIDIPSASKDGSPQTHISRSFPTEAPVTPPATPAVIHYRGASFDLLNPHDSLLFHDIETPSKDLDSTDYSPLRTSQEPLLPPEMAPKRALYTDLDTAYTSIRRRDDNPGTPNPNVPVPPAPAYLSPQSSSYPSPDATYESSLGMSPLTVKKAATDSRSSLKELPKSLARKFNKKVDTSAAPEEQELQDLSPTSPAASHFEGEYPRSLNASYSTIPPMHRYDDQEESHFSAEGSLLPGERAEPAPLKSMIPEDTSSQPAREDFPAERILPREQASSSALASVTTEEPSTQHGRGGDFRSSFMSAGTATRPYYEEVSSLYASSSVYGDAQGGNPPSLYSRRASGALGALEFGDDNITSPYERESIYSYYDNNRASTRYSGRLTQDVPRQSLYPHNEETDTISKFIGQYEAGEGAKATGKQPTSGPSQFKFQEEQSSSGSSSEHSLAHPMRLRAGRASRPKVTQAPGSPPHHSAPLEPAFEYDDIPEIFNRPNDAEAFSAFSPGTSYGDTRNLLGLSETARTGYQSGSSNLGLRPALEPSSSYSQSETQRSSNTPKEALDQAEQIFEEASSSQSRSIPAIWSRRASGNLLRNRHSTVAEENEDEQAEWETVGERSRPPTAEGDDAGSTADYSDTSEDRRISQAIFGGYPTPADAAMSRERSQDLYSHPSPLAAHEHPFTSSPPGLSSQRSIRSTPRDSRATFRQSVHRNAATVPAFHSAARTQDDKPYFFMPDPATWTREAGSPYALSEKETQELLNSGPNDDIYYEDEPRPSHRRSIRSAAQGSSEYSSDPRPLDLSPFHEGYNSVVLERENSFKKLTAVGPKGNLTGTPLGTGMKEVGSSVADNSSPGQEWSPNVPRASTGKGKGKRPSIVPGFYVDPTATSSESVIRNTGRHERTPSRDTVASTSTASDSRSHRYGRSAVRGQTKLREMMLARDTASVRTHSTHFSDMMRLDQPSVRGTSFRGSSANTDAPLQPAVQGRQAHVSMSSVLSPHLQVRGRQPTPEDEKLRKQLSWALFAVFFLLSPLLLLFRFYGDSVVAWVSGGRFDAATTRSKRCALYVAAPLNIFLVAAIIVPIMIKYA